jgi:hypothetical protein
MVAGMSPGFYADNTIMDKCSMLSAPPNPVPFHCNCVGLMPRIVIAPQGSFRKGDPIPQAMPFVIGVRQPIYLQAARTRNRMHVWDVEGIRGAD